MDQIYKLTPKEFADMLKFSTSYIRKLRLAKKLEGWYTVIDGKYFYRVPDKDRPNLVSETPHQNPKFTGSRFRPKKYKSLYYKKKGRRRHLPATEDTNYHNARNGWQLEQLNNLRQMARIKGELEKDELLEITPEIFQIARERHIKNKRLNAERKAREERLKTDEGRKEERWKVLKQRAEIMDSHYEAEDRKGGWYNQSTGQYEKPHDPWADKKYY